MLPNGKFSKFPILFIIVAYVHDTHCVGVTGSLTPTSDNYYRVFWSDKTTARSKLNTVLDSAIYVLQPIGPRSRWNIFNIIYKRDRPPKNRIGVVSHVPRKRSLKLLIWSEILKVFILRLDLCQLRTYMT